MVTLAGAIIAYLRAFFVPRHKLVLEAVALRQQLAVVKRKQPHPKLDPHDRWFWIVLRRLWDRWSEALIIVQSGDRGFLAPCRIPAVLAVGSQRRRSGGHR
jgi:hypothetical protein